MHTFASHDSRRDITLHLLISSRHPVAAVYHTRSRALRAYTPRASRQPAHLLLRAQDHFIGRRIIEVGKPSKTRRDIPANSRNGATSRVTFGLLGPLEVSVSGCPIPLKQRVQRIVLAKLALSANHVASVSSLIDAIWQDEAEGPRLNNLQYQISRLRSLLRGLEPDRATSRIITYPSGYRFVTENGERDIDVFSDFVRLARDAVAAGRYADGGILYRQALSLCRGQALEDVRNASGQLEAEAKRLEETAISVLEERLDADLACLKHRQVVGELMALTAQHPYRERLRTQLMTALYACGRQVEALEVYASYVGSLRDEFGLDPGPDIRQVQQKILTHDLQI
jgi:DNA-binding SARP family transcriptional activator